MGAREEFGSRGMAMRLGPTCEKLKGGKRGGALRKMVEGGEADNLSEGCGLGSVRGAELAKVREVSDGGGAKCRERIRLSREHCKRESLSEGGANHNNDEDMKT